MNPTSSIGNARHAASASGDYPVLGATSSAQPSPNGAVRLWPSPNAGSGAGRPATTTGTRIDLETSRKVVLYAEDQPDCAFLFRRAYERTGLADQLHIVADGAQAIAYLTGERQYADRARHPLPDVVFLDIQMPLVTGFEVLQWMKRTPRIARIPVYLISLVLRHADETAAKKLGASGSFVKPVSLAALSELILQVRAGLPVKSS
ncbi:hypothetical protein DB347_11930 [Opitutaceae bacterium EW11]|nr:hypothetical protein DB347_11930 [Opitutaceae bacterium EW11]